MNHANAMIDLCMLMMQRQLTSDSFAKWARRYFDAPSDQPSEVLVRFVSHHLEPAPLDGLRALEFDHFLMQPDVEDCEFTRAMIDLRNVFARHANLVLDATVTLSPP